MQRFDPTSFACRIASNVLFSFAFAGTFRRNSPRRNVRFSSSTVRVPGPGGPPVRETKAKARAALSFTRAAPRFRDSKPRGNRRNGADGQVGNGAATLAVVILEEEGEKATRGGGAGSGRNTPARIATTIAAMVEAAGRRGESRR